jgi:hypothetical protein
VSGANRRLRRMAQSGEFQAPLGGNGNPHPPLSLSTSTAFLSRGEVRPTIVLSIADVEDWPIFSRSGWQQRWCWRPLPDCSHKKCRPLGGRHRLSDGRTRKERQLPAALNSASSVSGRWTTANSIATPSSKWRTTWPRMVPSVTCTPSAGLTSISMAAPDSERSTMRH